MKLIYAVMIAVLASFPASAEVKIQSVESPGGLTAWLVEDHSIPFVALELRFRGGASLDEPGKRGAINLMTGLLEEGAGDMDARAFSKASEALATSFGFDASRDDVSISARFLTENRDASVALLQAAIYSMMSVCASASITGETSTSVRQESPMTKASSAPDSMCISLSCTSSCT